MTASQMISFVLNFGVMVGDLIKNKKDSYWQLYKLLRQILCYSLMSETDESIRTRFQDTIENHHRLYIRIIGDLIPKDHIVSHYPPISGEFGPVVNMWCMRQEAKHYTLKKYANVTANRINLPYSLAMRHQLVQSDYFLAKKAFTPPVVSCAKNDSKFLYESDVEQLSFENMKFESVKHAFVGKTKFQVNTLVLIKVTSDIPQFGKILKVYKNDGINNPLKDSDFILKYQVIRTVEFNDHFQAYEVEDTNKDEVIKLNDLSSHRTWNCIPKSDEKCFIVFCQHHKHFSFLE